MTARKRILVLGSTGSVGRSTVDLIARNRDKFAVEALTANRNAKSLAEQAISLGARFAAVADPAAAYVWTADRQRAHRLAPAIGSTSTWVNSHNPLDLRTPGAGRSGAAAGDLNIDFYTQCRTVLIPAGDTPVPRFGA